MGSEFKILEWIQRDLDGDLTPEERKVLMEYISRSPKVQMLYQDYKQLSDELSQLPKVNPPTSLVDSILPQLEEERMNNQPSHVKPKKRWKSMRKWLMALAAVVLLGITAWLWNLGIVGTVKQSVMNDKVVPQPTDQLIMVRQISRATPVFWSPKGEYQARWERESLVVRTADGKVQVSYQPDEKIENPPVIKWINNERIELILPGNKRKVVDVKQKKAVQ